MHRYVVTCDGDLADVVSDLNHSTMYLLSSGEGPPRLESVITLDLTGDATAFQWTVKAS